MSGRTIFRSAWLPVVFWALVILGLSSVPDLDTTGVGLSWSDKILHLVEYGILGFLFARAGLRHANTQRVVWTGLLLGFLFGSLDETYQRRTPGRDASAQDVAADTAGSLLGVLLWRTGSRRFFRRPRTPHTGPS